MVKGVQKMVEISQKENQPIKQSKVISSKKFNKIQFLEILGLLHRKFNNETLEFEPSWPLRLWFIVSMLSKALLEMKLFTSIFFPRNSIYQLLIGSFFNYVPTGPRMFTGVMVGIKDRVDMRLINV